MNLGKDWGGGRKIFISHLRSQSKARAGSPCHLECPSGQPSYIGRGPKTALDKNVRKAVLQKAALGFPMHQRLWELSGAWGHLAPASHCFRGFPSLSIPPVRVASVLTHSDTLVLPLLLRQCRLTTLYLLLFCIAYCELLEMNKVHGKMQIALPKVYVISYKKLKHCNHWYQGHMESNP